MQKVSKQEKSEISVFDASQRGLKSCSWCQPDFFLEKDLYICFNQEKFK